MDELQSLLAGLLANQTYVSQGLQTLHTRHGLLKQLLIHKKMPEEGWDSAAIEYIVAELSAMDSNNFPANVGVGEREGRVFSPLVSRRHYGMAHGVGRSGDIAEVQPKAAGSSLIYKLTNLMAAHAIELAGFREMKQALVLPLATGMTLTMCMLTLRRGNPEGKFVIWPRIDQKSCFKAILTAGLVPLVVQNLIVTDSATGLPVLETDVEEVCRLLRTHGKEVLCVLSTTSCFAPRQPDRVDEIAKLCLQTGAAHVVNNAYGLQCPVIAKMVNRAVVVGRVDALVQSTDKNFLVPVGGAVVAAKDSRFLSALAATYPGRASSAPVLDLFITLLAMGASGYRQLLAERERMRALVADGLRGLLRESGEGLLPAPRNTISSAAPLRGAGGDSVLGAMLFQRCVSGCRVVKSSGAVSDVSGYKFTNWGAHCDAYPVAYFTVACSVGLTAHEVRSFFKRLEKCVKKVKSRKQGGAAESDREV